MLECVGWTCLNVWVGHAGMCGLNMHENYHMLPERNSDEKLFEQFFFLKIGLKGITVKNCQIKLIKNILVVPYY